MAFMMSDMLRERRMGKMADSYKKDDAKDDHSGDKADDRCIYLTDEEQKMAMGSVKPGEEVTLQVKGRVNSDGKFDVVSVMPAGMGAAPEEDDNMTPPPPMQAA